MKKSISILFCAAWIPCLCFLSGCAPFSLDNLSSADTAYCFVKASAGVYPIDTDRPDEIAQFADLFDDFDWQLSESSPEDMPYDPWVYHIPEGKIPTEGTVMIFTKGETEILNAINKVLADLGSEGIQELVNKHLGITE